MNNLKNLYVGLIVMSTLLLGVSCKKEATETKPKTETGADLTLALSAVQSTLSSPFMVEVGEEFEVYTSANVEGVYYRWTVPATLTLLSGQGTNRIRLVFEDEGITVAGGSISVRAEGDGVVSATRRFEDAIATPVPLDVPAFVITGYSTDPNGTDAPYEFIQLRATRGINFETEPFTVVTCNNAGTSMPSSTVESDWFLPYDHTPPDWLTFRGWATGGLRSYKFELKTESVVKGEFFYIGGNGKRMNGNNANSADISSAKWITSASVGYNTIESPEFYPGGPKGSKTTNLLANSGNAFGIAAFKGLEVRETSIPIDVMWTGTARAYMASPETGYRIGNTDHYSVFHPDTGVPQAFYRAGTNTPTSAYSTATNTGWVMMWGGVFNSSTNEWEVKRRSGAAANMVFVTPGAGETTTVIETEQSTQIK